MLNIIQELNSALWKGQAVLHCNNDSRHRCKIRPEATVSQRWVGHRSSLVAHFWHTLPLCSRAVEEEFAVLRDADRGFSSHCAPESGADQREIWDLGAGIFAGDVGAGPSLK